MTDEQIIKALERCGETPKCKECPYGKKCKDLPKDTLDLIKRQKAEIAGLIAGQETLQKCIAEKDAEIEKLNKEVDRLSQVIMYHDGQVVDAIKEFADKVFEGVAVYKFENKAYNYKEGFTDAVIWYTDVIDNLVEEMVGDE